MKYWTNAEINKLNTLLENGYTIKYSAKILHRTPAAVSTKIYKLNNPEKVKAYHRNRYRKKV